MSQVTLGNGANALDYFHQYVKVLTPGGAVINPTVGRIGAVQPARRTIDGAPVAVDATPKAAPKK
jgi:hypothetical protein